MIRKILPMVLMVFISACTPMDSMSCCSSAEGCECCKSGECECCKNGTCDMSKKGMASMEGKQCHECDKGDKKAMKH